METSEEIGFISMLLPLAGIIFLIAIGVVLMYQQFQKNIIRQQLAKEALKSQHQKELLQTTIQVQEEERKRIAGDLHDELGAALSIGRMQILQLESEASIDPAKLSPVREIIETTLAASRRISHELMPLQLSQLGLEKALRSQLRKVEGVGIEETELVLNEKCINLPWDIELALYRIFSELINNTIKHAQAKQIAISFLCESNMLFARYADDGKGLPSNLESQGLGLRSLESRVKALEGEAEFGNQEMGGFYARIKIPLNHQKS